MSAELVGVFVVPELNYPIYIESMPPTNLTREEYRASMQTVGETFLNEIRETAAKAGVNFSGKVMVFDAVPSGIIKMAQESGCDMIFMSSHGQSGSDQLLLGSVTSKVLALSHIPVLVYRPLVHEGKAADS